MKQELIQSFFNFEKKYPHKKEHTQKALDLLKKYDDTTKLKIS